MVDDHELGAVGPTSSRRCARAIQLRSSNSRFPAFYTEEGRHTCQEALVHIGTLVDAFETYLLVGGFPQAVADFRRTAQVSDGFGRDLWDLAQSDLRTMGPSRPEEGLRLLERISASLTGPVALRSLASELDVAHRDGALAAVSPRRVVQILGRNTLAHP